MMTREDLAQFGFTRQEQRERDRIGWGGPEPKPEWRPKGRIVTSPIDLWELEEARDDLGRQNLGSGVPVHLVLWSVLPPRRPYLTRIGGVPWRPADRPWPKNRRGDPCTFVAQFCFADSRHLVSPRIKDDVLLVFFEDWDSWSGENVRLEWSPLAIAQPFLEQDVPSQELPVPRYSGVLYDTCDYPNAEEPRNVFMVARSQATKIGRTSFFPQHHPTRRGEELLCTLSSVYPVSSNWPAKRLTERWPLLDLEHFQTPNPPDDIDGFSSEMLMLGDAGTQHYWINGKGRVRVDGSCG